MMDQSASSLTRPQEPDCRDVRFIQQLRIRIGQAKNLQPRNGSLVLKDCFCLIKLDQEEIQRTNCSTERTTCPFFGEEFYFEIPRMFRFLCLYVYERDRSVNSIRNRPLGKVLIRRSQLCKFSSDESWFPLVPYDQLEPQGRIAILIEPRYSYNTNSLVLNLHVFECCELRETPFVSYLSVEFKNSLDGKIHQRKSKTKRRSRNPLFDESFNFEIPLNENENLDYRFSCNNILINSDLKIVLYQRGCRSDLPLGEVNIPLNKLEVNVPHHGWYFLQAINDFNEIPNNLGSLRLKINYIADFVFPSHFYLPLRRLLLSTPQAKHIPSTVPWILGEFVKNIEEAAQPLVKIFLYYDQLVPFISALARYEISKVTDVNTIFRGNSLVSKCIDELMKLVGLRYLHETLKRFVDSVIDDHKSCEIDPSKIRDGESLETNQIRLKHYVYDIFNSIVTSSGRCPQVMVDVFCALRDLAVETFPGNREVCYYVISGFVFLRFFAPAILNPMLFKLTDKSINARTNRTFTLISKTIQSIGNLVVKKNHFIKEDYMLKLYKEFITDEHIRKTKEFLDGISSTRALLKGPQEPLILKEGTMLKKSRFSRIGFRKAYRKKFFCLTTHHFLYSKAKNKPPLFELPLKELSVSKLPDTLSERNIFQIKHNDKFALQIQANNCVQEKEWLDTLNGLIILNQSSCPSSIFNFDDNQRLSPDLSIKLDPERELERISALFMSNMDNIQMIIEACEMGQSSIKINKSYSNSFSLKFSIEQPKMLECLLTQLKDILVQLDAYHCQYSEQIYGSDFYPIEVENVASSDHI